jgi:hypothetical protein
MTNLIVFEISVEISQGVDMDSISPLVFSDDPTNPD